MKQADMRVEMIANNVSKAYFVLLLDAQILKVYEYELRLIKKE